MNLIFILQIMLGLIIKKHLKYLH